MGASASPWRWSCAKPALSTACAIPAPWGDCQWDAGRMPFVLCPSCWEGGHACHAQLCLYRNAGSGDPKGPRVQEAHTQSPSLQMLHADLP